MSLAATWTLVAALSVPQQPDAALPLAGKRIAFTSPRAVAAPFSAELISVGARPVWWPLVEAVPLPESELGPLDDLIMRMPEYCAVALLSRHAADAFVERGARISDGDAELFAAMVDASGTQIAACGGAAARLRELGLAPSLVPLVPTADGLAAAICHLGLAAGGRRLRVVCSRVDESLLRGKEADEEALVAALLAAGTDADVVDACAIRPLLASGHELSLLREGGLDAVCVGSAEEANALAAALEAAEGAASDGVALPLGTRLVAAGAAAREGCAAAGLQVDAASRAEAEEAAALAKAVADALVERRLVW